MATVLIADDHPLTLFGIKMTVESLGYSVTSTENNGISAYNKIIGQQPDIALLDLSMPGMSGMEILEKINGQRNRTKIILCTMHNDLATFNLAKELGVNGYVLKDFDFAELEDCLLHVSRNECFFSEKLSSSLVLGDRNDETKNASLSKLTNAELKIIRLIAAQKTSKEIGETLFIAEKTVEAHRSHIMQKLDLPKEKNILLKWAMKNMG